MNKQYRICVDESNLTSHTIIKVNPDDELDEFRFCDDCGCGSTFIGGIHKRMTKDEFNEYLDEIV